MCQPCHTTTQHNVCGCVCAVCAKRLSRADLCRRQQPILAHMAFRYRPRICIYEPTTVQLPAGHQHCWVTESIDKTLCRRNNKYTRTKCTKWMPSEHINLRMCCDTAKHTKPPHLLCAPHIQYMLYIRYIECYVVTILAETTPIEKTRCQQLGGCKESYKTYTLLLSPLTVLSARACVCVYVESTMWFDSYLPPITWHYKQWLLSILSLSLRSTGTYTRSWCVCVCKRKQ